MSDLPLSKKELAELTRLMHSEAGKQLLAYLRRTNGPALQEAVSQAAAGNYEAAKGMARQLLSSPEVREMLKRLGR